jgi:hypothetical protein
VQEQHQSGSQERHRGDEQPGDEAGDGELGRRGDEQGGDDEADEQGAGRAADDREIGGLDAPREQLQLAKGPGPLRLVRRLQRRREFAGALDDAGQPGWRGR